MGITPTPRPLSRKERHADGNGEVVALVEKDGQLLSSNALPEGNDFPVSVSIKADASAKATYEKFNLNLAQCPTCKDAEYACTCAH